MSRQPSGSRSPSGSPSDPGVGSGRSSRPRRSSDPPSARNPSSDLPSRPRRHLLALAAGGVLAPPGCLSALGSSGESNVDVGLTLDRLGYEEGFGVETDSLAGTYGRYGVWGLDDGPGVDGPTYVGAFRDSLAVPAGRGHRTRWVTADVAVVVYRLEEAAYRVWLWAGARADQPDGGLGRSSLTRLSVGAAPLEGWTLVDFSPRGAVRGGPVTVALDERGPAGRTPLPGGGIGPDEGARTGPGGRFDVAWQGIARDTRSVNAVCELRRADGEDDPFAVTVSAGVAGGRGAL